jgi:hypothetical protein
MKWNDIYSEESQMDTYRTLTDCILLGRKSDHFFMKCGKKGHSGGKIIFEDAFKHFMETDAPWEIHLHDGGIETYESVEAMITDGWVLD